MTKLKPPLTVRDNDKDEAVRRAGDPAYAYDNPPVFKRWEPTKVTDLEGNPVTQEDVRVHPRKGTHSPMSNEGPSHRWPTDKDYINGCISDQKAGSQKKE